MNVSKTPSSGEVRTEPDDQTAKEGKPGDGGAGVLSPTYRPLTIGIVALVLLVAFEGMAVGTAMPVAVADLHGLEFYAWGFSGFMTASMFATVLSGELCDRVGPRLPFLTGVGFFAVGLVVAGAAPSMVLFVLGRMIQGLGGGAVVVALYVIVGRAFPQALRPRVFAAISSAWVLPSIVGPVIAGTITEHASWRWVFLGLVPFALVPIVLVLPRMGGLPTVEPAPRRAGRKRRALGAALGIGLLQYAGQERTWWSLLLVVVGVLALVVSLPRLLPPGTLRFARGLPSVVAMRGIFAGSFFGAQSFVPLMLIEHRGLSATLAGIALTVGSLGWSTGSWWQSRPSLRMTRTRLVETGAIFLTAGLALWLISVIPAVPVWVAVPGCVVAGLGMGLATASLSVLLLGYSRPEEHGAAGAAAQMSDSFGNVALVGLGGVIFAALHQSAHPAVVFGAIFASMIVVAGAGTILAPRVRADVAPAGGLPSVANTGAD
ncbi:MFS transporter [Actinopolymorpha pittospori]|uniref:MFS family permease n=1 Tax=Actinopolymorpha pittospori TaxID=648752 RepID=A0A927N5T1_9ACTN|nr:MFS family permease [Actinopolymorpha pittospori]